MRLRCLIAILGLALVTASPGRAQTPLPAQSGPAPQTVRTARYPALSPDGSRIAFSWQADIWIVPAAGGEARRIKHDGHDIRPKWSPDGGTL
ncbi:MAG: PD40 domain-containing protein, partial [Armatimonadetes bacterium]|nr:PD40 domain-containing protein [Armatimonadota bacterium]